MNPVDLKRVRFQKAFGEIMDRAHENFFTEESLTEINEIFHTHEASNQAGLFFRLALMTVMSAIQMEVGTEWKNLFRTALKRHERVKGVAFPEYIWLATEALVRKPMLELVKQEQETE